MCSNSNLSYSTPLCHWPHCFRLFAVFGVAAAGDSAKNYLQRIQPEAKMQSRTNRLNLIDAVSDSHSLSAYSFQQQAFADGSSKFEALRV